MTAPAARSDDASSGDVTTGAADAFISYSRSDREAARILAAGLRGRGRTLWVDWEGIAPTAEWMSEIRRGIDRAQGVLFLLSPASVRSQVCREEVAHAIAAGKRIVPVVVADVDPDEAPEELRRLNWVFARPSDDPATSLDQIELGLDLDLDSVRTHTRLLVRSTEWRESGDDTGRLLRGTELEEAERWLASDTGDPAPTAEQRRFVQASRTAATRRQRRLVVAVSLALVGSLLLAGIAVLQRRDALLQRDLADTQALASRSLADVGTDPARALQEAVDAAHSGSAPEVDQALRTSVLSSHLDRTVAIAPVNGRGFDAAWSTDGSVVFTSSVAEGLMGIDASTGQVVVRNPKLTGLWSVTAMPDGHRLVVAGPGTPVTFVDRTTAATTVAAAYADGGSSSEVAVSPDGRYLVTAPFPFGPSNVLDGTDGHLLRTLEIAGGGLPGGTSPITVDISPDSTTAAVGLSDGTVGLYDLATGAQKSVLQIGASVTVVRWSPSGHLLLTASQDRLLRIWDVATRALAQTIGQSALLTDAAWLGGDEYVVTADGAARARVWSVRRGDDVADLVGHTRGVNYVAVAPDGRHVATTADDGTLRTWDVGSGVALATLVRAAAVTGVDVTPDGRTVVAASTDGGTVAWEPGTSSRTRVLDAAASGPPRLSPDGREVAVVHVSDTDASVHLLALATGRSLWRSSAFGTITVDEPDAQGIEVVAPRPALPFSTAFSPDGSRLAVATQLGAVVLDAATGRRLASVTAQPFSTSASQYVDFAQVRGIAWSPDGTLIAVVSGQDVLLADPSTGAVRRAIRGGSTVASVAFPPRSGQVLASYADGQVREWSTTDGTLVRSFALTETALAIDVAGSGDVAATGRDGYLRIWSPDGVELQRTRVATIVAMSVRWEQGGQHLVVGTGEGLDDRVSFAEELGAHPSGTAQLLDCPVCATHDVLLSVAESRIPASTSAVTSRASAAPSSTVPPLPADLVGRWSSTLPSGSTPQLALPVLVDWAADGSFWYWSPQGSIEGTATAHGDQLVLDDAQCPGNPARYRYAVTAGALTLTAISDTCDQRKYLLSPSTWQQTR